MATILCIDESEVLLTRRLVLETNGYQVRTADTEAEALQVLRQDAVDCVLARNDPPWMDGLQVIAAIGRRHPGLPIVLVTPFPPQAAAPAAEYVSGLDGPEAMLAAVRRAVEKGTAAKPQSAKGNNHQQERERLDANLREQWRELRERTIETLRNTLRPK